jgi:hypothetical protein
VATPFVEDYTGMSWAELKYTRFDLRAEPLTFTLDLSNVPCGCLPCVYLVRMGDPTGNDAN